MLTVHQVSSHDAKAAARYLESVVEAEREARSELGSYYASEQAAGGRAFGSTAALAQLGLTPGSVDAGQLERLLGGYSATPPDPTLEPHRFEVDFEALRRLLDEPRHLAGTPAQRAAVEAVRKAAATTAHPAPSTSAQLAARCVRAGLLEQDDVPLRERPVRAPGMALDHVQLRRSIEAAIEERGGRQRLNPATRDAAEALLDRLRIGTLKNADRDVVRHARELEAAGLVQLDKHYRPTINSQDLTFSVPKTVSVLWAAASDDQRAAIEQAVVASAQAGVEYMSRSVPCLQRKQHDRSVQMETAIGVAATSFLHYTARETTTIDEDGNRVAAPADPQLHVHAIVSGVLRDDGKLVAPNQREWVRHGREGGAYFRSELAGRLRELGLAIEWQTGKDGRYFEVAGVPAELRKTFSKRAEAIEHLVDRFRTEHDREPTPAERDALVTRSRLGKGSAAVELDEHWREVCASHGLDRDAVDRAFAMRQRGIGRGDDRARLVAAAIVTKIEQRGATVTDREVRAIAYEASAGILTPTQTVDLLDAMQERGVMVERTLQRPDGPETINERAMLTALEGGYVTTLRIEQAERTCLAAVERSIRPLRSRMVERGIDRHERTKTYQLDGEQRDGIERSLGDRAVNVVVGLPGTGKGDVIGGVSAAVRADGGGVIAVATQGSRASGVGKQAGVKSRTIESMDKAFRHERLYVDTAKGRRLARAGDCIIVDEAGMVDTFAMTRLLEQAERRGMRVVLVGDPAQLDAIGVGGILRQLAEATNAPMLTDIKRTQIQWIKDMQTCIRAGRSAEALAIMRREGAAHLLDTTDEAMGAMLAAWEQGRREVGVEQARMIVHSSNRVVDRVNVRAQALRLAAGELGADGAKAPDRSYQLHVGDQVMFRRGAYDPGRGPRVENGTPGRIVDVDVKARRVRVELDEPGVEQSDRRIVDVDLRDCDRQKSALRLAYASHVFPAQGDTFERTYELAGGQGTANAASYVGASRVRQRHDLFTSRELLEGATEAECWQNLAAQMDTRTRNDAGISYQPDERRIATSVPLDRHADRQHDVDQARRLVTRHDNMVADLERSLTDRLRGERAVDRAGTAVTEAEQRLARFERQLEDTQAKRALTPAARRERTSAIAAAEQRLERARTELERARTARTAAIDTHAAGGDDTDRKLHDALARAREGAQRARERHAIATGALVDAALTDPPRYLTHTLGPRPADLGRRETWDAAARSVVEYRAEHGVDTTRSAIGAPQRGDRRAEWQRTARTIADAQRTLERPVTQDVELRHRADRSRPLAREQGPTIER